jgi:hypothetical protein
VKLTAHLQLMPSSENMSLCIHSLISLHGLVINLLSTGIIWMPHRDTRNTIKNFIIMIIFSIRLPCGYDEILVLSNQLI